MRKKGQILKTWRMDEPFAAGAGLPEHWGGFGGIFYCRFWGDPYFILYF